MEMYTPDEAAKILKVTPETVRKWLRNGELTGANTTAGWRLTPDDLTAWLDRQRQPRPPRGSQAGLKQAKPTVDPDVDPDACYQPEPGFSYEEIAAWGAK